MSLMKVNDMFIHKFEPSWNVKVLSLDEKGGIKIRTRAVKNEFGMEINVWLGDEIVTEEHISVILGTPLDIDEDSPKFNFF
jgi:hypothetical protein